MQGKRECLATLKMHTNSAQPKVDQPYKKHPTRPHLACLGDPSTWSSLRQGQRPPRRFLPRAAPPLPRAASATAAPRPSKTIQMVLQVGDRLPGDVELQTMPDQEDSPQAVTTGELFDGKKVEGRHKTQGAVEFARRWPVGCLARAHGSAPASPAPHHTQPPAPQCRRGPRAAVGASRAGLVCTNSLVGPRRLRRALLLLEQVANRKVAAATACAPRACWCSLAARPVRAAAGLPSELPRPQAAVRRTLHVCSPSTTRHHHHLPSHTTCPPSHYARTRWWCCSACPERLFIHSPPTHHHATHPPGGAVRRARRLHVGLL